MIDLESWSSRTNARRFASCRQFQATIWQLLYLSFTKSFSDCTTFEIRI